MLTQPGLQAGTQVSQSERFGRKLGEIGHQQPVEIGLPDHCAQTRKIVSQGGENAEPVDPVVDFQPLHRGEAVIRLDDLFDDLLGRSAVECAFAHALVRRERLAYYTEHFTLQFVQIHEATAFSGTYFLAFKASRCTSSKEGMWSSHSSKVAVGPTSSMARAYNCQTGSITGWSCVSRMYFSYLECPAIWIWATRSWGTLLM